MKNLLLLLLSLVPCRADLISSFTASISGNLADGTPFSASGDCGMMTVEAASTYCLSSVDYGQVDLIIHAAGSGPEGGNNLFASVSGTAGFTDSVTFTGQSGDGVVAWAMDSHPSPSADVPLMLPSAITFGASYPISIMVSDSVSASTGADETTATDFINMLGFRVFSTACDAELTLYGTVYDPAQCGTPLNVGIETASGFTYGDFINTGRGCDWCARASKCMDATWGDRRRGPGLSFRPWPRRSCGLPLTTWAYMWTAGSGRLHG